MYATLPVATAIYPALIQPDEYKGNKNFKSDLKMDPQAKADWNITIKTPREQDEVITGDTVQGFMDEIEKLCKEAYDDGIAAMEAELAEAKGKKKADLKANIESLGVKLPFGPDYDDEGDETGLVVFRTKTKATYKDKKGVVHDKTLPLYDSAGEPISPEAREGMKLWSGSQIICAVECTPWVMPSIDMAGVSLRLNAVQVIELSGGAGGNRSAESFGFGVTGGGFKADNFNNATAGSETTEETPEDDEEF